MRQLLKDPLSYLIGICAILVSLFTWYVTRPKAILDAVPEHWDYNYGHGFNIENHGTSLADDVQKICVFKLYGRDWDKLTLRPDSVPFVEIPGDTIVPGSTTRHPLDYRSCFANNGQQNIPIVQVEQVFVYAHYHDEAGTHYQDWVFGRLYMPSGHSHWVWSPVDKKAAEQHYLDVMNNTF